ncbi:NAD-dependent epimerase/dehydratase family protein [Paenibacillus mesophilus]|uniref:SDR family oxidoreductase n=1 Tax=Paenibacillus mesophilus TaxID=2582849 RepID=UPI00110DC24A|nr:NAD(P)H-binding protein [Paenibacillus mesophilus]TMV49942.1 NAD-dependent epimerase/dehydratase family protein [Paenibacillus mesophilus]
MARYTVIHVKGVRQVKIAVVGGTGMLGRRVSAVLRRRGHEVRVLSRRSLEHQVNLVTGERLDAALEGCDALVDASNASTNAKNILIDGTKRLLAAGKQAGISHHLCVSIVGCERIPMGYFGIKAEQEHVVEQNDVPWTIVRATQFHDYIAAMFEQAARWKVLPLLKIPIQTVAVDEVAHTIADTVEAKPRHGRLEIAGPEITDARMVARTWRSVSG